MASTNYGRSPGNSGGLGFEAPLWAAAYNIRSRACKLARMNLAIHGIDAYLGPRNAGSFRMD